MERQIVLGVPVDVSNLRDAASGLAKLASDGAPAMVCVIDVSNLMIARKSVDHMRALQSAAIITSDGMPIVWMLRALGHKSAKRVSGTDLMHELCGSPAGGKLRHYFYGGDPGTAEKVAVALVGIYGISVVGTECPPFRALSAAENEEMRTRIHSSGANIVWVGLGCPKQERWMLDHFRHFNATVIGVGAAFDFIAGRKARAPKWMQRIGLEWMHRLAAEPQRLWRRYLITASAFVPLALIHVATARFKHSSVAK